MEERWQMMSSLHLLPGPYAIRSIFPMIEEKGDNEIIYPDLLRTIIEKELVFKEGRIMTEQKAETLSQELSQVLEEIVTTPEEEVKRAVMVGDTTVMIDDVHYEIVEDYRDGFNIEALNERYNDIFERYDYIVGDWGHEKLRLKGFFKHSHKLATPDRDIDYLQEYLLEYCNFGCNISYWKETQRRNISQLWKKKNHNNVQDANAIINVNVKTINVENMYLVRQIR